MDFIDYCVATKNYSVLNSYKDYIQCNNVARTITLYPHQFQPHYRMFSSNDLDNSWLNKVWGYIQTVFGGGLLQCVISAVDAKNLYDKYMKERWSNKKLIEEVKKVAKHERNTTRVIWSVSGILSILGLTVGAAATLPLGGGAMAASAAVYLLILIASAFFGITIGGWLSKRGLIRIMEGYTQKKLMDKM